MLTAKTNRWVTVRVKGQSSTPIQLCRETQPCGGLPHCVRIGGACHQGQVQSIAYKSPASQRRKGPLPPPTPPFFLRGGEWLEQWRISPYLLNQPQDQPLECSGASWASLLEDRLSSEGWVCTWWNSLPQGLVVKDTPTTTGMAWPMVSIFGGLLLGISSQLHPSVVEGTQADEYAMQIRLKHSPGFMSCCSLCLFQVVWNWEQGVLCQTWLSIDLIRPVPPQDFFFFLFFYHKGDSLRAKTKCKKACYLLLHKGDRG